MGVRSRFALFQSGKCLTMDIQQETALRRKDDFFPELRRQVNDYFTSRNLSRYANGIFYFKGSVYCCAMVMGYAYLLIRGDRSIADLWAGYMAWLVSAGLLVITVAHDASHGAVSRSRFVNSLLAQSWNLLGMSRRIWEAKHHQSHHIHTNLPGRDVDIFENPILRFSPAYAWRPWHRFQHIYAPAVYLLFGPYQVLVKDFQILFSVNHQLRDRYLSEEGFPVKLVLTKVTFLVLSLGIPIANLSAPVVTIFLVQLSALSVTGFLILMILAVPHLNETGVWVGEVPEIRNQRDWARVQVRTTVDSSPKSVILAWLTGGLHTHLAHHLFPHICHVHYHALTPIISNVLENRGMAYQRAPAWKLLISHFRALRMLGSRPAPAAVPAYAFIPERTA